MYVICDSDGNARYVGQCTDVSRRIRCHLWAPTRVGEWMREEVRNGRLPVVRTLMVLHRMEKLNNALFRWSANALENFLIDYFHKREPGELVNRAGKRGEKERRAFWFPMVHKCPVTPMRYARIVANYDRKRLARGQRGFLKAEQN